MKAKTKTKTKEPYTSKSYRAYIQYLRQRFINYDFLLSVANSWHPCSYDLNDIQKMELDAFRKEMPYRYNRKKEYVCPELVIWEPPIERCSTFVPVTLLGDSVERKIHAGYIHVTRIQ